MATKFKVGDVVRLKSGGPEMTVHGESQRYDDACETIWFDEKKVKQYGDFKDDSIELDNE